MSTNPTPPYHFFAGNTPLLISIPHVGTDLTPQVEAGLTRLDERTRAEHDTADDAAIDAIRTQLGARLSRYRRRLDALENTEAGEIPYSPRYDAALRVRRAVIDAQREELLRLRDVGRLPDAGLRSLERELDHEEGLLGPQRA